MNPVFFGRSDKPLFGVYHPPRIHVANAGGVVLCYPFGQEYMRAHRAFRQLALLLTKAGFHVFRFDYYGTGDSAGEGEEGTIEQWVTDVGTAIEELKDTADLSSVSIVGLRLGAALGAIAASRRPDVDAVVFWDPVVDGAEYCEALITEGISHESYRKSTPQMNGGGSSVLGFPLTAVMKGEIEGIALDDLTLRPGSRPIIVVSEEKNEYVQFNKKFGSRHEGAIYRCIPATGNWNEVDDNGSALIPQAVILGIVESLAAEVVRR